MDEIYAFQREIQQFQRLESFGVFHFYAWVKFSVNVSANVHGNPQVSFKMTTTSQHWLNYLLMIWQSFFAGSLLFLSTVACVTDRKSKSCYRFASSGGQKEKPEQIIKSISLLHPAANWFCPLAFTRMDCNNKKKKKDGPQAVCVTYKYRGYPRRCPALSWFIYSLASPPHFIKAAGGQYIKFNLQKGQWLN